MSIGDDSTKQLSLVQFARQAYGVNNDDKNNDISFSLNLNDIEKSTMSHLSKYPTLSTTDREAIESQFGTEFITHLYNKNSYTLSRVLGKGDYGTVLSFCRDRYDCIAVKVQVVESRTDIEREIYMHKTVAHLGLAPKLLEEPRYFEYKYEHHVSMEMEAIDGTLEMLLLGKWNSKSAYKRQLLNSILYMIVTLAENNMTHGDFHVGNMGFVFVTNSYAQVELRPMLIDMAWTTYGANPKYDTLRMLRELIHIEKKEKQTARTTTTKDDDSVCTYLLTHIINFYKTNWDNTTTTTPTTKSSSSNSSSSSSSSNNDYYQYIEDECNKMSIAYQEMVEQEKYN